MCNNISSEFHFLWPKHYKWKKPKQQNTVESLQVSASSLISLTETELSSSKCCFLFLYGTATNMVYDLTTVLKNSEFEEH